MYAHHHRNTCGTRRYASWSQSHTELTSSPHCRLSPRTGSAWQEGRAKGQHGVTPPEDDGQRQAKDRLVRARVGTRSSKTVSPGGRVIPALCAVAWSQVVPAHGMVALPGATPCHDIASPQQRTTWVGTPRILPLCHRGGPHCQLDDHLKAPPRPSLTGPALALPGERQRQHPPMRSRNHWCVWIRRGRHLPCWSWAQRVGIHARRDARRSEQSPRRRLRYVSVWCRHAAPWTRRRLAERIATHNVVGPQKMSVLSPHWMSSWAPAPRHSPSLPQSPSTPRKPMTCQWSWLVDSSGPLPVQACPRTPHWGCAGGA